MSWWQLNIDAIEQAAREQGEPLPAAGAIALCKAVRTLEIEIGRYRREASQAMGLYQTAMRLADDLLEQRERCEDRIEQLEWKLDDEP